MHPQRIPCQRAFKRDDERNFDPTLGAFEKEGQLFKVKQDLYRLPHLSIDRLALLAKVDSFNTFDRIECLQKQGILTLKEHKGCNGS